MTDNPKMFVYIVVGIVIGLVVAIGGIQLLSGESEAPLQTESDTPASEVVSDTTTTPKPTTTTKPKTTAPKTSTDVSKGGTTGPVGYDVLVTYSSTGFSPRTIDVAAGTSVRFVNKSSQAMWISVVTAPGTPQYTDFSQSKSVGRDGTFDFTFNKQGVWIYENINDNSKTGIVTVR